MPNRVRVNDAEVRRALKRLGGLGPDAMRKTLERVSFDVRDDERRHVNAIFKGPGKAFLAKSFVFNIREVSPGRFVSQLFPRRKSARILLDHLRRLGGRNPIRTRGRLSLARKDVPPPAHPQFMKARRVFAVPNPAVVRRTARGKVSKKRTPQSIVGKGGRGFISAKGNAIVERKTAKSKRGNLRVPYYLFTRVELEATFRFFEVARRTVSRRFAQRARKTIDEATRGARRA